MLSMLSVSISSFFVIRNNGPYSKGAIRKVFGGVLLYWVQSIHDVGQVGLEHALRTFSDLVREKGANV